MLHADDDVIGHLVNIPIKDISKRDLSLKVVVSQNNNTSSKSFPFKIKNTMIFDGIDNIDTALTSDELYLDIRRKERVKKS